MMDLQATIARRLLQPAARWKEGRRHFNRYLHQFERTQHLSREELRDLQLRLLRELLQHAYDHTAHYRRQFQEAGLTPAAIRDLDDLRKLPTLDKRQVRAGLDDLLADNYRRDHLCRDQTGGSTGIPLVFYCDRRRRDSLAAVGYRHNRWTGWQIGERISYLWGAPRDFGTLRSLRWRLSSRFVRRHTMLDAAELTADRMMRFAADLRRWRPALIVAYSGTAHLFSKFLLRQCLSVPAPKGVVCTAELLLPNQRQTVETAFGAPVFERYGAREVGLVASECEAHQGLHIAADSLYVEVLAGDRPAAPGEAGDVVITDLLNYGMPMIRYRLGDTAMLADRRCDCGRGLPLMEMVGGRVSDFVVTPDGKTISAAYLTVIISSRSGLEQVQFVQRARNAIEIIIVPGATFSPADVEYVCRKLAGLVGPEVAISHRLVREIPKGPGGKHRFCVCEVAEPAANRVPLSAGTD